MKRLLGLVLGMMLAATVAVAKDSREEARIQASGQVLQEILNIPDDIPEDLLDKAECVVVIPGTKKLAIGIGGSFGRGVMTCRSGANYTGPWSAPAL